MDKYIYRNLKRGFSRKELNISIFDEVRLRTKYGILSFLKKLFDPCLRRMKDI